MRDVNNAGAIRVSVDVPSGLSADTNEIPGICIHADATVTFGCPKIPHIFLPAEEKVGEVYIADIGIPEDYVLAQQEIPQLLRRRALFLDRDGVINQDSDQFIKTPEEWKPIPGSLEAIARLNHAGYRVVVASNQSGIGRGLFDMATLNAMHLKMHRLFELGQRGFAVLVQARVAARDIQDVPEQRGEFKAGRNAVKANTIVPVDGFLDAILRARFDADQSDRRDAGDLVLKNLVFIDIEIIDLQLELV